MYNKESLVGSAAVPAGEAREGAVEEDPMSSVHPRGGRRRPFQFSLMFVFGCMTVAALVSAVARAVGGFDVLGMVLSTSCLLGLLAAIGFCLPPVLISLVCGPWNWSTMKDDVKEFRALFLLMFAIVSAYLAVIIVALVLMSPSKLPL